MARTAWGTVDDYAFPSRVDTTGHLSTRQYARLVDKWVTAIGLRRVEYRTHSMRRTKASMIYKATGNLRAIQISLGHTTIENTVRYLGVDIEDALTLARENLTSIDACTTRLRLVVQEQVAVNEPALKRLGVRGLIWPSPHDLQVVIGSTADQLARDIRETSDLVQTVMSDQLIEALGGRNNIRTADSAAGRWIVTVKQSDADDRAALSNVAVRGAAEVSPGRWHLLADVGDRPADRL